MSEKLLTIIVLSYNDLRIFRAISSILSNHFADQILIHVQDAGSSSELLQNVKLLLREEDTLTSESDLGIFDGLNKAVSTVSTPWLGWIGSDDLISPSFQLNDLKSSRNSIVSFSTLFFDAVLHKRSRLYFVVRSPLLRMLGFHLPHFSTFIKSSIAQKLKFDHKLRNYADQLYFIEAEKLSSVSVINSVSTLMQSGGSSNTSLLGVLKTNYNVFRSLTSHFSSAHAFLYIILKLLYKLMQKVAILFSK